MWEKLKGLFVYDGHFCRQCGARYNYPPFGPDCIVCKGYYTLTPTFRWWLTQFTKVVLAIVVGIILFDLFIFTSP